MQKNPIDRLHKRNQGNYCVKLVQKNKGKQWDFGSGPWASHVIDISQCIKLLYYYC